MFFFNKLYNKKNTHKYNNFNKQIKITIEIVFLFYNNQGQSHFGDWGAMPATPPPPPQILKNYLEQVKLHT